MPKISKDKVETHLISKAEAELDNLRECLKFLNRQKIKYLRTDSEPYSA